MGETSYPIVQVWDIVHVIIAWNRIEADEA
jgi:hypothetical protein